MAMFGVETSSGEMILVLHFQGEDIWACKDNGIVKKYCWTDIKFLVNPEAFTQAKQDFLSDLEKEEPVA